MEAAGFTPRNSDDRRESWEIPDGQISEDSSTNMYGATPNFQLQMIQKKEFVSERPRIYATKCQRLSFYRAYTSPEYKTEIIDRHHAQFNSFFWFYTFDLIFKSLPHTFVHIFLASYVPESHIFLPKMVPFCIGYTFLLIAASCLEIITYMNTLFLMFHYFIHGILYKNPWNKCVNSTYFDVESNETIHCYQMEEFAKQFINRTCSFSGHTYKTPSNESFQVAQLEYFRLNIGPSFHLRDMANFAMLWSMVAILTFHVSKKSFWKVLNYMHWINIFIDFCTFLYLIGMPTVSIKKEKVVLKTNVGSSVLWLDMIAESTTAPPVAHILTSRSTQPIDPSKDSTVIVLSNAALCIFRVLLRAKLTSYCENLMRAPMYYLEASAGHYFTSILGVLVSGFVDSADGWGISGFDADFWYVSGPTGLFMDKGEHNFFFIWTIFFSSFFLGDLYTLAFLGFNFLTKIFTVTVTFRCLIEMVIYEWKPKTNINPWMVIILMFGCAVFVHALFEYEYQEILYVYAKGFATLADTFILYIFYPLGRLVDDYTFHYGVPPTRLRKISLQLVPLYSLVKFIAMMDSLSEILDTRSYNAKSPYYKWFGYLMLVPIVLGIVYTVFKQLIIKKTKLYKLFSPTPDWGPKDYSVRQLRKMYDSRVYIKSAGRRALSRYLISKAESKVYKIDVRYDINKKVTSSTQVEVRFKIDQEVKKKSV